jgi:hypothetical protein
MNEFKWIEDLVIPETSVDSIELLKIIDEFDKFPSNLYHARPKRLSLLKSYMDRIITLNITNVIVADVADSWLRKLDYLIEYGGKFGRDKWYQKNIRKIINGMKKSKSIYLEKMLNPNNYFYGMTAEDMLMKWKK